jgi:hypothetical protein
MGSSGGEILGALPISNVQQRNPAVKHYHGGLARLPVSYVQAAATAPEIPITDQNAVVFLTDFSSALA